MEELISSHDLFVLQVEMDVYTMAKRVSHTQNWANGDFFCVIIPIFLTIVCRANVQLVVWNYSWGWRWCKPSGQVIEVSIQRTVVCWCL